jgi:hypothetical protein
MMVFHHISQRNEYLLFHYDAFKPNPMSLKVQKAMCDVQIIPIISDFYPVSACLKKKIIFK